MELQRRNLVLRTRGDGVTLLQTELTQFGLTIDRAVLLRNKRRKKT